MDMPGFLFRQSFWFALLLYLAAPPASADLAADASGAADESSAPAGQVSATLPSTHDQFASTPIVKPALMLANIYAEGVDLSDYWVSEKLDGVRAYWDGARLISRGGNPIQSPDWFTAGFPTVPLDGELWMGRGTFQYLSGSVRRLEPDQDAWREVRYMVFDLPGLNAPFGQRLQALKQVLVDSPNPHIAPVEQFRVVDHAALMDRLDAVVRAGGEGLMLHRDGSDYRSGRTDDLLKVKPYLDAEARVIEHLPGQGKYAGMLGALLVEDAQGRRFRLGTGFKDAERRQPPAVGSLVTFKYQGYTKSGIPRFASFLRVREVE